MSDKRYLFRGFHLDEQGDATIVVNGEKITGEWIYGYYLYSNKTKEHYIVSNESNEFVIPELEYFQSILKVIPETVGQFVTTDKNGKDVFEGDIVRFTDKYGAKPTSSGIAKIEKGEYGYKLNGSYDKGLIVGTIVWLYISGEMEYELIGNKWECEV